MPRQYQQDGDKGFIGLNSREHPASLKRGVLSLSENFRLNRGVATVRRGCKRLFYREIDPTDGSYPSLDLKYVTTFKNIKGEDLFVFICKNCLFTYNALKDELSIGVPIPFPANEFVEEKDNCDAFQALDKLYILRGFEKRPLVWDGYRNVSLAPNAFPKSKIGIYHSNRAIVQSSKDEISVSRYLDLGTFNLLDVFRINDGSNDQIVAVTPWVLNELVVFMRNRIYYASVGSGAYSSGDSIVPEDCYVKVLATDIGCVAKNSIVQADSGIIFLSDYGIYKITPQAATTPEGMRVGVLGEPMSADIEDVILRINQDFVNNANAAYHNNRYYLSVPVNGFLEDIKINSDNTWTVLTDDGNNAYTTTVTETYPCNEPFSETYYWEIVDDDGWWIPDRDNIPDDSIVWEDSWYEEYIDDSNGCVWKWTESGWQYVPKSMGVASLSNNGQLVWAPIRNSLINSTPSFETQPYYTEPSPCIPPGPPTHGEYGWVPKIKYPGVINIKVPYRNGYNFQPGDSIFIDGIDYIDTSNVSQSLSGTYTVVGITPHTCNQTIIISVLVPYFNYQTDTVIKTNTVKIRKIATVNNCILVYNFINKMWESVDNYNSDVDFKYLVFGIRNSNRRLYVADKRKGLFLIEEVQQGDEFGKLESEPLLDNYYLPFLLTETIYGKESVRGRMITRAYDYDNIDDKRYSSAELNMSLPAGGKTRTSVIVENPDITAIIDTYEVDSDSTSSRDVPICKFGSEAKIMVETYGNMPSIRSVFVSAVDPGSNTKSSE